MKLLFDIIRSIKYQPNLHRQALPLSRFWCGHWRWHLCLESTLGDGRATDLTDEVENRDPAANRALPSRRPPTHCDLQGRPVSRPGQPASSAPSAAFTNISSKHVVRLAVGGGGR